MNPPPTQPEPLDADKLTWAALLARWVEFARSALALPDDDSGRRLRDTVPDIIMLQAVWFALADLGRLQPEQRALGLDRAEILIDKHTAAIHARWANEPLPELLAELIDDARGRLAFITDEYQTD